LTLRPLDGYKSLLLSQVSGGAGRKRRATGSPMTMLQAKDGEHASYLEIAEAIEERSPDAGTDLRELWRVC
jgi:serine/threonine-protein kinase HipA